MNMATLSLNISLSHCDRQFSIIGVSSVGRYLLSCCVERDISGGGRENEARDEGRRGCRFEKSKLLVCVMT